MSTKPTNGFCKFCHAQIRFAEHKVTGRDNRLDIEPHPNGNALLDQQRMRYEFLTGEDLKRARQQGIPLYIAHAATCVNPPLRHGGAARRRKEVSRI